MKNLNSKKNRNKSKIIFMQQELYILDLIGTFAFALYGAYFALKKKLDIFGVIVLAFLTAVGGGTIRSLILGDLPMFYFIDVNYIIIILLSVIFTVIIYNFFHKIKKFAIILDSIGLVTFAFIGASKAASYEIGLFGVVFIATLTAVGGGVLRDLMLNKVPDILHHDFYASIAILLGVIFSVFKEQMENIIWANLLIFSCFILRLIVIIYDIHLWKPRKNRV